MKKGGVTILYEDDYIIALDKPAGLLVHSDGIAEEETLSDWILKEYPSLRDVGEKFPGPHGDKIARPGIVHRLDRDTSGVIIVAKGKQAYIFLKNAFKERKVKKVYQAIVHGVVKEHDGVVEKPTGRSRRDFRKREIVPETDERAHPATTHYKVLRRFTNHTFIELYPKTGRTHQIRVHMTSLGHPLLCDHLYAGKRMCPASIGRTALHSRSIELTLPDGLRINIESPLHDDFKGVLAELGEL